MDGSVGIVSLTALTLARPETGLPVGGAETQLYLLAQALAAEKIPVTLYVADLGQGPLTEEGIRFEPLLPLTPELRLRPRHFPPALLKLKRGHHRLYVTRGASSINGLTCLAAHWGGGRHMHMVAHDEEAAGLAEATLSFLARRAHHFGLRHADVLTCQNGYQKEALQRVYRREASILPSLPHATSTGEGTRAGFLWVGRDIDFKAPELFIELARRLPDLPFTMVCQRQPGRDIERLRAAAPPNLRFIPGAPYPQVRQFFASHKACVCTSRAEGFPNTFVQAAGAGTPILSLTVNPDNILALTGAGLAFNGDFEALVSSSRRLAEDEGLWRRMSEGARQLAARQAGAAERVVAAIRQAMQG